MRRAIGAHCTFFCIIFHEKTKGWFVSLDCVCIIIMCQQHRNTRKQQHGNNKNSTKKKIPQQHDREHAESCASEQQGGSHVSIVLSKRIRNAKKRLAKAQDIQRKADSGKELNEDQKLALKHVDRVESLIEELEKMSLILDEAVEKDVMAAVQEKEESLSQEMQRVMREKEVASKNAVKAAAKKSKAEGVNKLKQLEKKMEGERKAAMVEGAQRMVEFLYMSTLFDPYMPYQVEKNNVVNYIKDMGEGLDEQRMMAEKLDMIGLLGKMMTSQPLHCGLSHEESVKQCQEIAKQYIEGDEDAPLGWNGSMTRGEVHTLVKKVKGMGCFTMPANPPVNAAIPAPPPPPMETPVSEYYMFPEYVSPEAAAATGQNVLNQFFAPPVQPTLDAPGYSQYDGLGMHEVVADEQHHGTNEAVVEEARVTEDGTQTDRQVNYHRSYKKKNSELALENDSRSNTKRYNRGQGKRYGFANNNNRRKHREQVAEV